MLVLCATLLAGGAHWDVLQGVAWTRMAATNARSMPLVEALRATFAPGNECSMCEFIARSKSGAEEDTSLPPLPSEPNGKPKWLAVGFAPAELFVAPPPAVRWEAARFSLPDGPRATPPTPPPKSVA